MTLAPPQLAALATKRELAQLPVGDTSAQLSVGDRAKAGNESLHGTASNLQLPCLLHGGALWDVRADASEVEWNYVDAGGSSDASGDDDDGDW